LQAIERIPLVDRRRSEAVEQYPLEKRAKVNEIVKGYPQIKQIIQDTRELEEE
jgi:hypothetical protein